MRLEPRHRVRFALPEDWSVELQAAEFAWEPIAE